MIMYYLLLNERDTNDASFTLNLNFILLESNRATTMVYLMLLIQITVCTKKFSILN